jgi:hypothetical protein
MSFVLHILVHTDERATLQQLAVQQREIGCNVSVEDLTQPEADYRDLLDKILRADSITVW